MSAPGRGASGAQRLGSASNRVVGVWRRLPHERRLAAIAAVGLFFTLFLPWYQETVIANGVKHLQSVSASLTGWGAFSFVEAAVLLVSGGVLVLLFMRAEGNAFHVPGGDGGVITAAGLWTCVLIVWRIFDKQGTTGHGQYATTSGIEWGIFVALAVAAVLAYAGTRIRRAHEPEPPLPGDRDPRPAEAAAARTGNRWGKRSGQSRERSRRTSERAQRRPERAQRGPDMGADDAWTEPTVPAPPPARGGDRSPEVRSSDVRSRDLGSPGRGSPGRGSPEPGSPEPGPPEAGSPATEAPRRIRPRSVGAPQQGDRPAGRRQRPDGPASAGVGDPPPARPEEAAAPGPAGDAPPAGDRDRPHRPRGLDPREIQELDIAEPPTPRLSRSRPVAPRSSDADDQLTIRGKRPN